MGLEAKCKALIDGRATEGLAHLDSDALRFRGARAVVIPFKKVTSVTARRGSLEVDHADGRAVFQLGAAAEKWALKIRFPKSRIDKLGVRPDHKASVVGIDEPAFRDEIERRCEDVSFGRPRRGSDLVLLGATSCDDLAALAKLEGLIARDGAIWVVWPKGRKELREDDVRTAARKCGLVDVKVMAFSQTHSGLKLVIPVARR